MLVTLAVDDKAARLASAQIDEELAENARHRQAAIVQAPKLEDGTAMFLTEDGSETYTEHGNRLAHGRTQELLNGVARAGSGRTHRNSCSPVWRYQPRPSTG